jgi:transcriptional regulator with XRE-family HTH domain
MENLYAIKDRLREAMNMQNMNAATLARNSGVDKSAICRYLKGKSVPKSGAVLCMANALHVTPQWLIGYDTPVESEDAIEDVIVGGLEEALKSMMITSCGSVNKFAQASGLKTSTVSTALTRGIDKTNFNTIIKICQTLNISIDALVAGRLVSKQDLEYGVGASKLSNVNKIKLKAYYQGLLDAQGDK